MAHLSSHPRDPELVAAKAALRNDVRQRRAALTANDRRRASDTIVDLLVNLPECVAAHQVMLYGAAGEEVAVDDAAAHLRARGAATLYPRVAGDALEIVAVADSTEFLPGFRGIREPAGPAQQQPALDVVVVPGIAFDRAGRRLGQGKGYYDRLLATTDATRIAVAFSCQIVDVVPADALDARMDVLITEDGVVRIDHGTR